MLNLKEFREERRVEHLVPNQVLESAERQLSAVRAYWTESIDCPAPCCCAWYAMKRSNPELM